MRLVNRLFTKRYYAYGLSVLAGATLLAFNGLGLVGVNAQSTNSLYVTPASGSYQVGNNFTVAVRVNTSEQINTVGAELSYSANLLQFVSIDGSGSALGIDASSSGGGGSVSISRGTTSSISGDQLVANVTFKVLSAGTASVQVQSNSEAFAVSTNNDVLTAFNGASFNLSAPASPTPTPPSPTPPSTTSPAPKPAATSTKSSSSIAPQGNSQSAPLPGGSKIELEAPATVETTPDPNKTVQKVEYLLNGKLISTDTTPPYTQDIDIKSMRNGDYTLVTKTYYTNGTFDSSTASLKVNNPMNLTQLWLQLRHYAWLVIILLIVAGELVYLKFFRNRGKFPYNKGGDVSANVSGHGEVVVGGSAPGASIQPSVTAPTPQDQDNTPPPSPRV